MSVAAFPCHLADFQIGVLEQLYGSLHSQLGLACAERDAERLMKEATEMPSAAAGLPCNLSHGAVDELALAHLAEQLQESIFCSREPHWHFGLDNRENGL